MTASPGMYDYPGDKAADVVFVDCPGLSDSDKLVEYSNQTAVHMAIMACNTVKILWVFEMGSLTALRGQPFLQELYAIA